jgi:hypothetical protein
MSRHCKAGDTPTVYYSFAGGAEQNVTFHLAPIDVQVVPKSDAEDASGGGGPCYPNGAPAIGKPCDIVYSSWMVWMVGDRSAIGDGYATGVSGGGPLPDLIRNYYDAGYRDETDGWRYIWSYRETYLTETDEDGTRYKFFFVVTAGKRLTFTGQPPSEKPSPYETVGDPGIWGLLSDSCGWTGDSNCRMSVGSQPPPGKKKVILKVSKVSWNSDNKEVLEEIWSAEGEPECIYKVACEGCPEGYLKLKANNPKGFCCIPCKELQAGASQIKALVRRRNG